MTAVAPVAFSDPRLVEPYEHHRRISIWANGNSKVSESTRDVTYWTSVVRANVLPNGWAVAVRKNSAGYQAAGTLDKQRLARESHTEIRLRRVETTNQLLPLHHEFCNEMRPRAKIVGWVTKLAEFGMDMTSTAEDSRAQGGPTAGTEPSISLTANRE